MAWKRQKRRFSYSNYYSNNGKTKVTVHWSSNAGAYQIQFHGSRIWQGKWMFPSKERFSQVKDVLAAYIMKIPYGERDQKCVITTPDIVNNPENKLETWYYYLVEKSADGTMMSNDFELDFVPKPVGEINTSKFVPVEVYLDKFKEITGQDIRCSEFSSARSIYRKSCLAFHPDRNPDNKEVANKMSELNETWYNLEVQHFKTKKEVPQLQEV
jgi:hypothetical protein